MPVNFDVEGLKSLVYVYSTQEGIITCDTWEKIICKSVGGTHIPGDIFMSDGVKDTTGVNVKSILKKHTKGNIQTCSFVQCRCPLNETTNIGEGIIKTLVNKRQECFNEFGLDQMVDVIIIHNRIGDNYNVRVFAEKQTEYEKLDLEWYGGNGYINPDKSKKKWEEDWKLKRNPGNASGFQTCLFIKKVFDVNQCIANFTVKCDNNYDISMEDAKKRYADSLISGTLDT